MATQAPTSSQVKRDGNKICVKIKAHVRRDGTRVREHFRCFTKKDLQPKDQAKLEKAKKLFGEKSPNINGQKKEGQPKTQSAQEPESVFEETINVYKKGDQWDPERAKLHEEIEASVFEGAENKKGDTFYMMGGAPANGKSTFVESEYNDMPMDSLVEINSDSVKAKIPEYQEKIEGYLTKGLDSKNAAHMVHEESSELSKKFVRKAIDNGYGVLLDGTGDNSFDKLKSKVDVYRAKGHKVVANYTTLDTDLALKINEIRYKSSGRYVPPDYIREVSRNLTEIVPRAIEENLFDEFRMYDTNTKGVAKLIAEQKGGKFKILDKKLWERFLAKKND